MKDSLIALILTTQLVVILTGSASVCPTGYSLDTAYQLCLANGENVCAQGFRLNPKPACLAANLVVSFRQPCNNQFEFNIASGSCQQPRSCPANKRFGRNCIKDPSFRGGVGQPNFFPISQSATALPSLTQFNFQISHQIHTACQQGSRGVRLRFRGAPPPREVNLRRVPLEMPFPRAEKLWRLEVELTSLSLEMRREQQAVALVDLLGTQS
jgi:hypothetical protein